MTLGLVLSLLHSIWARYLREQQFCQWLICDNEAILFKPDRTCPATHPHDCANRSVRRGHLLEGRSGKTTARRIQEAIGYSRSQERFIEQQQQETRPAERQQPGLDHARRHDSAAVCVQHQDQYFQRLSSTSPAASCQQPGQCRQRGVDSSMGAGSAHSALCRLCHLVSPLHHLVHSGQMLWHQAQLVEMLLLLWAEKLLIELSFVDFFFCFCLWASQRRCANKILRNLAAEKDHFYFAMNSQSSSIEPPS